MKDKLTTASLIAPVLVLMLMLCLGSFVADAQQPTPPRIGWLAGGSPPAFQHLAEAFRQGMRERGYIDGQNFILEIRAARADSSDSPSSRPSWSVGRPPSFSWAPRHLSGPRGTPRIEPRS